jgi:hypothetical protein
MRTRVVVTPLGTTLAWETAMGTAMAMAMATVTATATATATAMKTLDPLRQSCRTLAPTPAYR